MRDDLAQMHDDLSLLSAICDAIANHAWKKDIK